MQLKARSSLVALLLTQNANLSEVNMKQSFLVVQSSSAGVGGWGEKQSLFFAKIGEYFYQ